MWSRSKQCSEFHCLSTTLQLSNCQTERHRETYRGRRNYKYPRQSCVNRCRVSCLDYRGCCGHSYPLLRSWERCEDVVIISTFVFEYSARISIPVVLPAPVGVIAVTGLILPSSWIRLAFHAPHPIRCLIINSQCYNWE